MRVLLSIGCSAALLTCALGACNGPDASLLRKRSFDAGPGADGGSIDRVLDGGSVGPTPTPIDPGAVDGPTESIDCMSDGEFTVCTRPHAESTCVVDDCLIVRCLGDWVDCDGDSDNGCETTLLSVDHCGRCGAGCALTNVLRHSCDDTDGRAGCAIDHACAADDGCADEAPEIGCKPGFGDCDGDPANGCEMALEAVSDCGTCGRSCQVANTVVACERDADDMALCITVGCAPGFGNCSGEDCSSLASDAMNCGECGTQCPAEANMCAGGRCTSQVCDEGTADCNGEAADACEVDLADLADCGTCGNACPVADNATSTCSAGACDIQCDPGFEDCDGDLANGCEADITALSRCGSCNNDCGNLPHVVSARCTDDACVSLVCEDGWDDCNGIAKDGCEQPLNTLSDCGACGSRCGAQNGVGSCTTGACQISACDQGFDDCNGVVEDGCEANLGKEPNCGGCGIECGTGSSCNGSGCECIDSTGCLVGECCDGTCVDTTGTCRFWPCVPGDNKDFFNCGACAFPCIPLVHQGCCGIL